MTLFQDSLWLLDSPVEDPLGYMKAVKNSSSFIREQQRKY